MHAPNQTATAAPVVAPHRDAAGRVAVADGREAGGLRRQHQLISSGEPHQAPYIVISFHRTCGITVTNTGGARISPVVTAYQATNLI